MAKLESWQRYRKAKPCPVCGGYGAYRPENRCKGFLKADGSGAYCSNPNATWKQHPIWFEALGLNLYWHPFERQGEGEDKDAWRKSRLLALRAQGLLRRQARQKEARRPPTGKDFG